MIIQFCGLSGSGKSTLANRVKELLNDQGIKTEIIDGDVYRKILCADLSFSKADRHENIRRLSFVASILASHDIIPIICAINPYENIRLEIVAKYEHVITVYINCSLEVLKQRDTKQLYRKAFLAEGHPEKINNLTVVNDPFEIPAHADLTINTDEESIETSSQKLLRFILSVL
ncbi:MAG: adenylyl-sulfate kinase [Chitinophagaceae bacterium]